jgi:hypothetical protein
MIAAASTVPMAMIPGSWPLIGRAAAAAGVGAVTGAAQTAASDHPSAPDILKNMAEQGALYGGSELGTGLLSRAFSFLRGLRGVKQAAGASATETAAQTAATSKPSTTVAPPTEKPAGDIIGERLGILDKDPQSLMTSALKPGTNNTKWATDMQKAFPDLKAAEAELGQPIKSFADAKNAVKTAKANLWSQFESSKSAWAKCSIPDDD